MLIVIILYGSHIRFHPLLPNGKLAYSSRYYTYKWNNYNINYIEMKNVNPSKIPILFIHGLGSSVYHFRYNYPELSKNSDIYSIDLLGFGASNKPIIDYNASLWVDQIDHFINTKIKGKCLLVGNSIGANLCLEASLINDEICGIVCINPAGKDEEFFNNVSNVVDQHKFLKKIRSLIFDFMFKLINRKTYIKNILEDIYHNKTNVDEDLIRSIYEPLNMLDKEKSNQLFEKINLGLSSMSLVSNSSIPILLLWGIYDSWIDNKTVELMKNYYPKLKYVEIKGGHCCHDENPTDVNNEITSFLNNFWLSYEL